MNKIAGCTVSEKDGYYEISNIEKDILIKTKKYEIGINFDLGEKVKICKNDGGPLEMLKIGDNVRIDHDSTILVPSLWVMDYTKINNHFYSHGTNSLEIGYNCWIGSNVVLDTLGGLKVGNNVGIGSQAQVYSHAKFGDTLYGCRFNSYRSINLEDDVWIGANSVITSATMLSRSMILAGCVLTKDTLSNHVYAGVPAKDITEKTGNQFNDELDYKKIEKILNGYLDKFYIKYKNYKNLGLIKVVMSLPKIIDENLTYFIVKDRKYIKRKTDVEISFMKYLLPDKAKFLPLL